MATTMECSSCGAQNDVIFGICLFCKKPLPQLNDTLITNEELVMSASDWVARTSEMFLIIKTSEYNEWSGKGMIRISHGEIIGYAEKYMNLLKLRSINNPQLFELYKELREKQNKIEAKGLLANPQLRVAFYLGIVVLFGMGIMMLLEFFGIIK